MIMNPRPAGMSDEDNSDEDEFYTGADYYSRVTDYSSVPRENNAWREDERTLETNAMNGCINGNLEPIQKYLEVYDINKFMHTGWSLLLHATSAAQFELIEYLLQHDADPNKSKDGFTPLMALCSSIKGSPETRLRCLLLLIEVKADVNATSKQRDTVLMYACKSQDVNFVIELLKHVENINICDSDGKTALIYAVMCRKADIVAILLEHNADTTLSDRYNLTALNIANEKNYTEISALLADEKEEKISYCEISQMITWEDLFPELYPKSKDLLDYNIATLLYGMGLEQYNILFRGMDLKTFLQLKEENLCRLGIDLTVHREQFLENLHKFHCKKWRVDSIGFIKKSASYTIFDGVISLANIKHQIGAVASSFQYIKNNLMQCAKIDIHLDAAEKLKYEEELRKTQNTLKLLKDEINHCKKLALEINKKDDIGVPAHFITSPKKRRNSTRWIIPLSVTLIIGLYIYKSTFIHRL